MEDHQTTERSGDTLTEKLSSSSDAVCNIVVTPLQDAASTQSATPPIAIIVPTVVVPKIELPIDAKQIFSSSETTTTQSQTKSKSNESESDSDEQEGEASSEEGPADIGELDYNEADVDPFDPHVEKYEHLIPKADTIDINLDNGKIEKSSISAAVYHLLHMSVDRDDLNFATNMSFLRGFIWNFDLFITPTKLMQIIIIFYRIRMNQSDLETGKRLIGFLAELINARFLSLDGCKPFKRLFFQFFTFLDKEERTNSQFIMNTWTANQNKELNSKSKLETNHFFGQEQLPIQTSYYTVVDFSPLSTAQVLSEVNQVLFFNITMIEFRAWSTRKKNPQIDFGNIDRLIEWFNQLTLYVQTTLIVPLTMTVKEQLNIYSHWVKVMQCMVDLQNFEGIAPIFFGLSSPSAISKLEALLPKDLRQIKQSMEALIGPMHNYLLYRSTFEKNINKLSPYVPQQCVLLKDLTCLEENKTILKGKVHWFKLTLVGEILDSIRLARSRRYNFWQNSQAEAYINDIFIFLANGYRSRLPSDKLQEVVDLRVRMPDTPEKKKGFGFQEMTSSNPLVKAMSKRDSLGSAERRKRDSLSASEDHSLPEQGSSPTKGGLGVDGARDGKKRGQTSVRRASDTPPTMMSGSLALDLHQQANSSGGGTCVTPPLNSPHQRVTLNVSSGSLNDRRRVSTGTPTEPADGQSSSEGPSPRPDGSGTSGASSPKSHAHSPHSLSDSSGQEARSDSHSDASPLSPHKKKEKFSALDKMIRYVNKPSGLSASTNTNAPTTPKIVEPGDHDGATMSKSSNNLVFDPHAAHPLSPKDGVLRVEEKKRNRSLSDVTSLRRPGKK